MKVFAKRTNRDILERIGFAYLKEDFRFPVIFSDIKSIELENPNFPGEKINYTPRHIFKNYDKLFEILEILKK